MSPAPVFSKGRDLAAAAAALEEWLPSRLGGAEVVVSDLTYPQGNRGRLIEARGG